MDGWTCAFHEQLMCSDHPSGMPTRQKKLTKIARDNYDFTWRESSKRTTSDSSLKNSHWRLIWPISMQRNCNLFAVGHPTPAVHIKRNKPSGIRQSAQDVFRMTSSQDMELTWRSSSIVSSQTRQPDRIDMNSYSERVWLCLGLGSDIRPDNLSGFFLTDLSRKSVWQSSWHSFWHIDLTLFLTYLSDFDYGWLCRVRVTSISLVIGWPPRSRSCFLNRRVCKNLGDASFSVLFDVSV